jgi:hypothetical protein
VPLYFIPPGAALSRLVFPGSEQHYMATATKPGLLGLFPSHVICNSSSAMTRDSPVPVGCRSLLCFAILSRMVYDGGPGPHIQSLHTMTLSMLRHTEWSLHVWTMTTGPTGEGMRRYRYQLRSAWALAGNSVSAQRSHGN